MRYETKSDIYRICLKTKNWLLSNLCKLRRTSEKRTVCRTGCFSSDNKAKLRLWDVPGPNVWQHDRTWHVVMLHKDKHRAAWKYHIQAPAQVIKTRQPSLQSAQRACRLGQLTAPLYPSREYSHRAKTDRNQRVRNMQAQTEPLVQTEMDFRCNQLYLVTRQNLYWPNTREKSKGLLISPCWGGHSPSPPASLPQAPASSEQKGGKNSKRAVPFLLRRNSLCSVFHGCPLLCHYTHEPFLSPAAAGMCSVIFPVRAMHSVLLGQSPPNMFSCWNHWNVSPHQAVSSCSQLCALRSAKVTERKAINFNKGKEKQNLKRNTIQEQSWGWLLLKYYEAISAPRVASSSPIHHTSIRIYGQTHLSAHFSSFLHH